MTVRFTESFEQWATTNARLEEGKWTTHQTWDRATTGVHDFRGNSDGGTRSISKSFALENTWVVGFRTRGSNVSDDYALGLQGGGNCYFRIETDGSIGVYNDMFPTPILVAQSAVGVVSLAVENYLWCKATLDASAGAVVVYANGEKVIDATGLALIGTGATDIIFRSNNGSTFFDDIVILDTNGTKNNDIPTDVNGNAPDVHVERLLTDANGTHSDFTPSTGLDNFAMVDEDSDGTTAADDDTTHNELVGLGKDSYQVEDLSGTDGDVMAVNVIARIRKTETGARAVKLGQRNNSGTSKEEAGSEQFLAEAWAWYYQVFEDDPDGTDWTVAGINAEDFEPVVEVST